MCHRSSLEVCLVVNLQTPPLYLYKNQDTLHLSAQNRGEGLSGGGEGYAEMESIESGIIIHFLLFWVRNWYVN